MTHFATADEDLEFVSRQLERFGPFVVSCAGASPAIIVHAANSAATLRLPRPTSTWSAAGSRSTAATR